MVVESEKFVDMEGVKVYLTLDGFAPGCQIMLAIALWDLVEVIIWCLRFQFESQNDF